VSAAALAPDRRARIQAAWDNRRRARIASAWDNRKPHGLDTGIYAPPPRRGTKAGDAPAWVLAEEVTRFSDVNLARAFVAMGFTRRISEHLRIATPLMDFAAPFSRLSSFKLQLDKLEWRVVLMARPDASAIYVCTVSGNWVTETGGARGERFASLMGFMKNLDIYQACAALLRANGYGRVPRVAELSR
jgi:hypothetical protein